MAEEQQRLRWGRIAIITLVGLGFAATPFYLAHSGTSMSSQAPR